MLSSIFLITFVGDKIMGIMNIETRKICESVAEFSSSQSLEGS